MQSETNAPENIGQQAEHDRYIELSVRAGHAEAEALVLRKALAELVRLKDGPRDAEYERCKGAAWDTARLIVQGKYRYAVPEAASNAPTVAEAVAAERNRIACRVMALAVIGSTSAGMITTEFVDRAAVLECIGASEPAKAAGTLDGDWDSVKERGGGHWRISGDEVHWVQPSGTIREAAHSIEYAKHRIRSGEWTQIDSPPGSGAGYRYMQTRVSVRRIQRNGLQGLWGSGASDITRPRPPGRGRTRGDGRGVHVHQCEASDGGTASRRRM